MEMDDLIKEKESIEKQITFSLREFEDKYKIKIKYIEVSRIGDDFCGDTLSRVKLDVRL